MHDESFSNADTTGEIESFNQDEVSEESPFLDCLRLTNKCSFKNIDMTK